MRMGIGIPVVLLCFVALQELPHAQEIPPDAYTGRRARLMKELGGGLFVIRNERDPESPNKPNSDFFYLTGIEDPDPILVLAPDGVRVRTSRQNPGRNYYRGKQAHEILFLPSSDPLRKRWEGDYLAVGKEAEAETGIQTTYSLERFDAMMGSFAAEVETIAFTSSEDRDFIDGIKKRFFWANLRNIEPLIAQMRRIKSRDEIAMLQRSVDIIGRAIESTLSQVRPGMWEYEIQSLIEQQVQAAGAMNAFPPIVGSGPNGTVLHYRANRRQTEEGDLIVLDVGADYRGYDSDISRTFPVSGYFSPRQREVYETVLRAQNAALQLVKAGALIADIHAKAYEVIEEAGYGEFFVHGTSHYVGLDTHDAGSYHVPLEPGVVITVEPGIYIPEEQIGVRIEDVVLVKKGGHEHLSGHIPRDPEAIESLVGSSR